MCSSQGAQIAWNSADKLPQVEATRTTNNPTQAAQPSNSDTRAGSDLPKTLNIPLALGKEPIGLSIPT